MGRGLGKYLEVTFDIFVKEKVGIFVDNFLDRLDSNEVVNRVLNETVDRSVLEALYEVIDEDIALAVTVDGGLHVVDNPKIGDEFVSVMKIMKGFILHLELSLRDLFQVQLCVPILLAMCPL